MRTVYKQKLKIEDVQTIDIHEGAKILHIGKQFDSVCIWYECDDEKPMTKRTIYCFGTGHEMPVDVKLQYIGTIILSDGELVFHFFEKEN